MTSASGDGLIEDLCLDGLLVEADRMVSVSMGASLQGWLPPSVDELRGVLPGIEIIEMAGRGSMGAVYRGRQEQLDRDVAVKVLPQEFSRDPVLLERFRQEARSASQLRHPGIVTVHDFGQSKNGLLYLCMEYIDGTTLQAPLRDGSVATERAIQITTELCDALQHAHEHGVVHRDIKPSNILLDSSSGRVILADFGVVTYCDQTQFADLTETNGFVGTRGYAAPEQFNPMIKVDRRADLYAVGIILFEMLAGELPSPETVEKLDSAGDVRLIELQQLIRQLLSVAPDDRPESAQCVSDALRRLASPHELRPTRLTSDGSSAKWSRIGIAVLTTAVFICVVVTAPWHLPKKGTSDSQANNSARHSAVEARRQADAVSPLPRSTDSPKTQLAVDSSDSSAAQDLFVLSQQIISVEGARRCTLADVNNDESPDLILTGVAVSGRNIWLNHGTGYFTESDASLPAAYNVSVGDVDGDEDMDLWMTRRPEPDLLFVNDGNGEFTDSGQRLGQNYPFQAVLADLDGDEDLDCYMANGIYRNDSTLPTFDEVLLNDGDGNFEDSGQRLGNTFTWAAVAVDLNGDGHLDICTAGVMTGQAGIWWNKGRAMFREGPSLLAQGISVVAGDLNGDGGVDLILGREWDTNQVFMHQRLQRFILGSQFDAQRCRKLMIADFDRDGIPDVFSANSRVEQKGSQFRQAPSIVWRNDGSGQFHKLWQTPEFEASDAAIGDVDGDSDVDILLLNRDGDARVIFNSYY